MATPGAQVAATGAGSGPEENWGALKFLPAAAASVALGVIGTCRHLAFENGHLPAGANTPPISLFGIQNPEYRIYSAGMTVVAGLFVAMARPMHRYLTARAAADLQDDVSAIYSSGLAAFAGLAGHAVLPLQGNIVALIQGERGAIEWTTTIHQSAAGVFFAASMYHGWTMIQLQLHPSAAGLTIGTASGDRLAQVPSVPAPRPVV